MRFGRSPLIDPLNRAPAAASRFHQRFLRESLSLSQLPKIGSDGFVEHSTDASQALLVGRLLAEPELQAQVLFFLSTLDDDDEHQ